jgi:hypothetical protein
MHHFKRLGENYFEVSNDQMQIVGDYTPETCLLSLTIHKADDEQRSSIAIKKANDLLESIEIAVEMLSGD